MEPSDRVDWLASQAVYVPRGQRADLPDSWAAIGESTTDTFRAWTRTSAGNGKRQVLVAVRGTASAEDWGSNSTLLFNGLEKTPRALRDIASMTSLTTRFPPRIATYFLTGHSLGSAIGLMLQKRFPFVQSAVYFNGAMQRSDVTSQPPNTQEIYQARDPLYRSVGWLWRDKEVVDTLPPVSTLARLTQGRVGQAREALAAHALASFAPLFAYGNDNIVGSGVGSEQHVALSEEHVALSDGDMRRLLGPVNIFMYPELGQCARIEDCLDELGRCVVLFLTSSKQAGHWQGLLGDVQEQHLEVFDSFGTPIDGDFQWLSREQQQQLGETRKEMSRLVAEARSRGWHVTHNAVQLQRYNTDTCGRFVALRMLLSHLSLCEFQTLLLDSGDPDAYVTRVTTRLLENK